MVFSRTNSLIVGHIISDAHEEMQEGPCVSELFSSSSDWKEDLPAITERQDKIVDVGFFNEQASFVIKWWINIHHLLI